MRLTDRHPRTGTSTTTTTTKLQNMNVIIKNRLEMFLGVNSFSEQTGLPANARATALFADNKTVITNMTTSSAAQAEGRGRYLGASTDRLQTAQRLRCI